MSPRLQTCGALSKQQQGSFVHVSSAFERASALCGRSSGEVPGGHRQGNIDNTEAQRWARKVWRRPDRVMEHEQVTAILLET